MLQYPGNLNLVLSEEFDRAYLTIDHIPIHEKEQFNFVALFIISVDTSLKTVENQRASVRMMCARSKMS